MASDACAEDRCGRMSACGVEKKLNGFGGTVLAEAFQVTIAMAERDWKQNAMMDLHTPNPSMGLSPDHAGGDDDEADDWWTPAGIVDEQEYAPHCSCDGDDAVNHAGRKDLTDWWKSGKGFQAQYPALSWTHAIGDCSTAMHSNMHSPASSSGVCDGTSDKRPSARHDPPLPCLPASPLVSGARAVSCDGGDPNRNGAHKEEEGQSDCEYDGWNPGGIADADEGYAPSCPCP
eukprot:TRINITY_DN50850_c0_g1_i1.p1 TRINITY_DN50850_c0_g1~~TRINITY_DN50850_c0_g1_i1.p1  ORF type:complete len:249 (+),score=36.56 TRINITY_DN50850_c0_g1_i1:52-747(+)